MATILTSNSGVVEHNEKLIAAFSEVVASARLIAEYARRCEEITDSEMSHKLIYEELEASLKNLDSLKLS